jgi:hypothetical protein
MVWRFTGTLIVVFVVELILFGSRLPSWLHGRPVPGSIWLGLAGFALAMGVLIAVIELVINALRPRRGRFGRREPISILDYWPF